MDYENYNNQGTPPNNYGTPPNNYGQNPPPGNYGPGPESNSFSTAAMILGIISLVTSCCLYISIPVGAIGIILALLSKGSSTRMDSRSKTGLGISIAGIGISVFMIIAVLVSNTYMGNTTFEKMYQDYLDYYGYDSSSDGSSGGSSQQPDQNSQDLEDYFNKYFNGGDNMPKIKENPKSSVTPVPNDAI
ncbi:DUF4190 domain-containing protein [Robinsoniella peoriensis]|uniref:DUF4190 domain-containing protein n=1 Tax=Robinsoniella peoriensis TaxID=180332 RepID=UPI0006950873|nr:DUF4190 domain-containing protein [Robinsoniella peoriensis]